MDFLCVSFQVLSYPLLVPQIPTTPLEMSLIIKHPPNYKLWVWHLSSELTDTDLGVYHEKLCIAVTFKEVEL